MAAVPTSSPEKSSKRSVARLSLVPLGLLGGFFGGRRLRPAPVTALPPALTGEMAAIRMTFGQVMYYRDGPMDAPPLLLVHSVNAAASAYEVKPLYEYYARARAVYALDLPGFGFSDRHDRIYTPRLMADAVLAMVHEIRARHGAFPIDAIAVSTSCEFLARAASEHPTLFRTIALISPTGMQAAKRGDGPPGSTYGIAAVRDIVSFPLWRRGLYDLLVSRPSIGFFLRKVWGSSDFDEGLFAYDYLTAHQPHAEFAPFSFIAGFLFSADIMTVYKALTQPVFMSHGVRGDFVDYKRKSEFADRPKWTIEVFPTGAMTHFERLGDYTAAYDAFLGRAA